MTNEEDRNNSLPVAIERSIVSPELGELGLDVSEMAVDLLLEDDGLVEQIPLVKSLYAIGKQGFAVRDKLFLRKMLRFLSSIQTIPLEDRQKIVQRLSSEKTRERAGDRLWDAIDRFDSSAKADLLGGLFLMLAEDQIEVDEFWRLVFVLDRLPFDDLSWVAHRVSIGQSFVAERRDELNFMRTQSLISVGVIFSIGASKGLNKRFARHIHDLFEICYPEVLGEQS